MFTLIVSAALILSNVSLFWVVVKLLKPSQRRICGDERASHASKLKHCVSLSDCATGKFDARDSTNMWACALLIHRVARKADCSTMRIMLQNMWGDGRKRLMLLRTDPAHVCNKLKLCLWCRACTAKVRESPQVDTSTLFSGTP